MDYTTTTTIVFFLCAFLSANRAQQTEEVTYSKPYVFSYTAGRMPGHVDRIHSESADGQGTIKGMFSYVDPRQQIRTVEYVADKNGFHPVLTNPTQDTTAVQNAKAKHHVLFSQIAAEHQRVSSERGQHNQEEEPSDDGSESFDPNLLASLPRDTPVVEKAKLRHYDLYNRIALEHAKIAAERAQYGDEEEPEEQESHEKIVRIGF